MPSSDRSAQIQGLYQEMILDHYRRPRNKGEIADADETVVMKNPLCGDEITVQLRYDGDEVAYTYQAEVYGHLRAYGPTPPCASSQELGSSRTSNAGIR